jgi:hypothetical protein
MLRTPFVWETHIRREILDDELIQLRRVPYSVWRQIVLAPLTKRVKARDNKDYQLRVTAQFVRGTDDIRVTLRLARQALFRRHLMRQTFVVTADERFLA